MILKQYDKTGLRCCEDRLTSSAAIIRHIVIGVKFIRFLWVKVCSVLQVCASCGTICSHGAGWAVVPVSAALRNGLLKPPAGTRVLCERVQTA